MKKIKLKMSLISVIITAVVIACVLFLNAIIAVIGEKAPMKIDLTRDKIFEFSQQTKDVMKNLDTEIKAYALIPDGMQGESVDYIKEYLDKYKSLSDKFKVSYVDPYEDPSFMYKYTNDEEQPGVGSVIIENGDEFKIVASDQIFTYGYSNEIQIDMERKVTNAIMAVTGTLRTSDVYFTAGHGETSATGLRSILEEEGYKCNDIVLSTEKIPEKAKILFCVAPMADFTAEERNALDAFTDKGGRFVFIAAPGMQPMERIDSYIEEWGLKVNYDLVMETDENSSIPLGYGMTAPVAKIQEHTITEKLMGAQSPLVMAVSTSISAFKSANNAYATKLLLTTEKAYGANVFNGSMTHKGPLCMAAISEKTGGDVSSAILVLGSVTATEYTEGAYLNTDFILNAVNYLSGSNESVSIRAKQISPEKMTMTQGQVSVAIIVLQWILPLAIIIIGLIVWLKRRYK